jgi:glycosyltransferase involved in cell wall biosynthesis
MNILIVGGTPAVRGGVELFVERAEAALLEIGGHHVETVHSNTSFFKSASVRPAARCVRQLLRLRREPWDCVWLQYVNFPELLLLALCRLLGYRVLVTPHLGANWSSQSNVVLRRAGRFLLSLAHGFALISPIQDAELQLPPRVPRFQIRTFLPRAFPYRLRGEQAPGPMALVHAARLSTGKGTFLFLDVCRILKERGCAFSARLIGSGDPATRARIDEVVAEHRLGGHVAVLGALPERQLMAELSEADGLVHLSSIDSFPLIVLESIACGVFPICKDLPGARAMVERYCGRVVEGPGAASEAAEFLLASAPASLRQSASRASAEVAADYGWEECVKALEAAVRKLNG